MLPERLLDGKTALITGCNRGIGRAILKLFVQHGAKVYANARIEGSLDSVISESKDKYQNQIIPLYFDLTDPDQTKKCIQTVASDPSGLDILVNNAGISASARIGMISEKLIRDTFEVNVFATIRILQYAAKIMMRKKSGSIINISSVAAEAGLHENAGQAVYASTKGAVNSLTKAAAKELAEWGIRVNGIAPGVTDTDMARTGGDRFIQSNLPMIKLGRLASPEEIAEAALFFASPMSSYITGQVLSVDGGALL